MINNVMSFGYKNFKDFRTSNFGKWSFELLFVVVCVLYTIWNGLDHVLASIDQNVFSPATVFILAMVSIFIDWLSGMYRGWIKGQFSTKKAQRIIPKLLANGLLLSMYFYMHKYFVLPLNIQVLTDLLETGKTIIGFAMFGIHTMSFLSNCAESELIHGKLATWIKEKVDKHKNKVDDLL